MSELISFERRDGVARLVIDRQDRKNALTLAMADQLIGHLETIVGDTSLRVVLLTGAGADFCAGADVGEIGTGLPEDGAERGAQFSASVRKLSLPLNLALRRIRQPIVAAVRGHAIGVGFQLVLASDIVIASETAQFSAPQVKLGHCFDHGESLFLPHKIGTVRAAQLSLLGERWSAGQAERYGLVNWVLSDDAFDARVEAVVAQLAAAPPIALQEAKAQLAFASEDAIARCVEREAAAVARCAMTEDFVEALTAFGERRTPVFTGR